VLVNLHKCSLGMGVLWDDGVVHCFKLQVFGGGRRGGEFLLEDIPDIGGILFILIRMDEGRVDSYGKSAEALVIGIVPVVNPSLVGDLIVLILLLSRHGGGDGISSTNGAKVASDEGHPLLVVGALESGDTADEEGGGIGHFVRELVLD